MEAGNDINRDIILTLLRTYTLTIARVIFNIVYSCIMPQQKRDDPLYRQEEGRIQQGCYPWDDEYSDEEDDEEDASTGITHQLADDKDCEKKSSTTGQCKG